ncbi:MAG: hypothetical protein AAGC43_00960 [Bacteroidota bacterium]
MKNTTKLSHKLIAVFLTFTFLPSLLPVNYIMASNTGPNAPEAAGFEPVDATDMVNLGSGDLAYSLPLMDVDGFPITLGYHAGITSTLDASWAGLGWYLNTGAINRQQIGVPDDWKGGTAINFISYEDAETTYNIGVGFAAGPAEAGVGVSWGGNKGISGSVSASVSLSNLGAVSTGDNLDVGIGASASTDGGYYIGGYANARLSKNSKVGINASAGYSSSGWTASGNLGLTQSNSSRVSSIGIGYDTSGTFSINGGGGGVEGITGGGGMSMGSFSSGDYDVSVSNQGFKISGQGIGIPVFLKFGRTKVTYSLRKGYKDTAYGAMYSAVASKPNPTVSPDNLFTDYQNRYTYMDVYEQTLPQEEEEFITDFRPNEEKLNFTYAGYDNFEVQANGLNGRLKARIFDNVTLFNRGFDASDTEESNRKKHVFYHKSGLTSTRGFGQGTNHQMQMYFEGGFSSRELIAPSTNDFTGSSLSTLVDNPPPFESSFASKLDKRATTPSYVEVFTNEELYNGGLALGIVEPENLPFSVRNNSNVVDPDGIGAYKITSPDGKTYHFTIPVYHYETVKRTLLKTANQNPYDADDVSESRQYNKYATHWLLTAVTGPDYVDTNSDGRVGGNDYGYWVRLDHGKWSDGYTWKQPYEDEARLYTTNRLSEIDDEDFGYFSFGRKQLYYLNKIVSREHTAFFVKDIRHDAVGKTFRYSFANANAGIGGNGPDEIGATGNQGGLNQSDENLHVRELFVPYEEEYTLRLDKIALVKNDVASNLQTNSGSNLGSGLSNYQENQIVNGTWRSPDFRNAYSANYEYLLHQEDNVIDVNDFTASGIQSNVLREIRFQHSYDLAKNSPNSIVTAQNPFKGKLTLDRVQFLGKGGANYMPPYAFEYYDEEKENISLAGIRQDLKNELNITNDDDPRYRREYTKRKNLFVDNWGYIQGDEDRWSLKSIQLPQGATINLTYEEDKYWIEAFARRYWEDNLQFAVKRDGNAVPGSYMYIYIRNEDGISSSSQVDFNDYFTIGEQVYLDLWLIRTYDNGIFSEDFLGGIDLPGNYSYRPEVDQIADNTLVIKVYRDPLNPLDFCPPSSSSTRCDTRAVIDKSNAFDFDLLAYFDNEGKGSNKHVQLPRGEYENSVGDGADHHTMSYKLLANKVPENEIGGGLRVTKIETLSSDGNTGVLEYNYNFPTGHERAGRSSGITSFSPVDGLKFVPYQSELPNPGVQYEYVTLFRKDGNGDILDYTRYNFHVLKPVFDIFKENIVLEGHEDLQTNPNQSPLFEASVASQSQGDITSKSIDVRVNTAILGQFKEITQYNPFGHAISKVSYDYTNGEPLTEDGKGYVRESFNSLKSVFQSNTDGVNNINLDGRLLSISTRTDYSNMLQKVTNQANGLTTSVEYGEVDAILGSFRESKTLLADGTYKREYRIPAYEVYSDMGPKSLAPANKNMLTQEAMMITDVGSGSQWNSTSATVTTWKNSTLYNADASPTNDGIWRKHESYVWDNTLDAKGTFGRVITSSDFDWNGSEQTNPQWQKISETTRYDNWSSPLEVKDINDTYASTKMGDNATKIYASGNAGYNEIFYSGAEDLNGSDFGGEVLKGTAQENSTYAHTGSKSLRITSGQNAFQVAVTEGKIDQYKVSLWSRFGNHSDTRVRVGSTTVSPTVGETVRAGEWVQLNYYFTVSGTQNIEVFTSGGTLYVDDFRLHPVNSSVNSYVYNQWDELTHILGANNMGTQYEYDSAGRLSNTYTEVADFNGAGTGGFKQTSNHQYNYQDLGGN